MFPTGGRAARISPPGGQVAAETAIPLCEDSGSRVTLFTVRPAATEGSCESDVVNPGRRSRRLTFDVSHRYEPRYPFTDAGRFGGLDYLVDILVRRSGFLGQP
jgi:hypothetical protein